MRADFSSGRHFISKHRKCFSGGVQASLGSFRSAGDAGRRARRGGGYLERAALAGRRHRGSLDHHVQPVVVNVADLLQHVDVFTGGDGQPIVLGPTERLGAAHRVLQLDAGLPLARQHGQVAAVLSLPGGRGHRRHLPQRYSRQ